MSDVRVRFAPSPTGYLHVGGARTALFNFLFARHKGGIFILRIEDTDVERSSAELETVLLEDMRWLGLDWDEGPEGGGARGPYRQSERVDIYREHAEKLVSSGAAYPCFCTDDELELKREQSRKSGLPPRYDGTCRELSEDERQARRRDGRPESKRFRITAEQDIRIDDLIRGEVVFPPDMVGDFVIMRSNGLPTYNFAAAVDDALMEVTHVIRGEEHLPNTIRQLMIYESLGFDLPAFAHIPLILGDDRSKLSKRHGAPNIKDFRDRGYPPGAIVNYLAFLGWSPKDEREIFTMDELAGEFTLESVANSPAIFDETKLNWFSARHIRAGGSGEFFDEALPFFPRELVESYDRELLAEIFDIISENLPCYSRIEEAAAVFLRGVPSYDDEAAGILDGTGPLLEALADRFGVLEEWAGDRIKQSIKETGAGLGLKGKALFMPLRVALTGSAHGPDLATLIRIRGRDDTVGALRETAAQYGGRNV
ncbi:MAG: glutamate--tRNA ligase [Candidatus Krumholzibacteria bacterium]|nr:glutamate--tRNA ligase [Candidatus Krumholzibacteria bacterium]